MSAEGEVETGSRIDIKFDGDLPGPFREMDLASFIKSPRDMGMNPSTSGWGLDTIGRNFGGLMSYIQLLVSGTSRASRVAAIDFPISRLSNQQPLGHAYFFNTGFKCTDSNGRLRDAVAHINTVPLGNIPFISMATGNLQDLRGLLPSMFESIGGLNPMILLSTLDISNGEPCNRQVETDANFQLPFSNLTRDGKAYNRRGDPVQFTNAFMFDSLVRKIDPCLFRGPVRRLSNGRLRRNGVRRNPLTGQRCRESFSNINDDNINDNLNDYYKLNNDDNIKTELDKHLDMLNNLNKSDWLIQLYYISFSILIIFIIVKILNKHNKSI